MRAPATQWSIHRRTHGTSAHTSCQIGYV